MIKNIILDFGDIFINLDKPATAREMKKYGLTEITPELDHLFKTYEMGVVTSKDFLTLGKTISPSQRKSIGRCLEQYSIGLS